MIGILNENVYFNCDTKKCVIMKNKFKTSLIYLTSVVKYVIIKSGVLFAITKNNILLGEYEYE